MNKNVISETVKNDLCIGCGTCAYSCPVNNLKIDFDHQGKYSPIEISNCLDKCNLCLKVCPFAPEEYSKDEIYLAKESFSSIDNLKYNEYTGYYSSLFIGNVQDNALREKSSSGGIARFLLVKLLKNSIIDNVIHVIPNDDPERLFKFALSNKLDEISNTSSSVYYPVEMSEILDFIKKNNGNYAITALPCFIKSLRMLMQFDKVLNERIKFIFGLTCGQMKTKKYTKYVSFLAGLDINNDISNISYRCKKKDCPASNYHYTLNSSDENLKIFWTDKIAPVWMNNWFTPNACNYCDDVYGELADISFMDAWLPEYTSDWRGTNILISRSELLSEILDKSHSDGELFLTDIKVEEVIKSQQGVINIKRQDLAWRLHDALKKGKIIPNKRVEPIKPNFFNAEYIILIIKEIIRKKSFDYYPEIFTSNKLQKEMKFYDFLIKLINLRNSLGIILFNKIVKVFKK